VPTQRTRRALVAAAASCHACPLGDLGTQTVFGAGPRRARLMLVGEQPGDEEDRSGRPFVGPAGRLLDRCLAEAGIARDFVYVTNVVKHFKWEPKGKVRLHQRPNAREVRACLPWLEAELELVRPRMLVALGATAAQALFGATFRVSRERGRVFASSRAPLSMATVHPSAVLRSRDAAARHEAREQLVADLREVAARLS